MKAVLNYFVRKAFAPLRERLLAIQRNIHEVYAWLYGRLSAEHLPRRMPMVEREDGSSVLRPMAQTTDNLLRHLRLLDGRKISNGFADGTPANDGLPDGVSLARILCDSTCSPTALIDDNIGWVMDKTPTLPSTLTKLVLGCKEINNVTLRADSVAELELPYLEEFKSNVYSGENRIIFNGETLYLPKLRYYEGYYNTIAPYVGIVACGAFKNFIAPNLEGINDQSGWHDCFLAGINNETPYDRLEKVVLGKLKVFNWGFGGNYFTNNVSLHTNLIHFEIGEGTDISLNCSKWNPTMALRTDTDAEDYVDLREDMSFKNNRELFLSNFRLYIAERLSSNGSGKTLTLSQEVRNAIHAAGIDTLITNKGWTISPVPTN